MNRVLRRPMFRTGGTAEGITSGLAPRQGYADGSVKQSVLDRSLRDFYEGDPTIREVRDLSREVGFKPRGTNVYDFLTEFGLDIASRSPVPGGIVATAATSAKGPYERFMERKQSAAEQEYGSQSSMFKALLEAGATASGEKSYAHRDRYAMIKDNVEQQLGLRDELSNPETTDERASEIKDEIRVLRDAISDPEFSKAMLKFIGDDQEMRTLKVMVKNQVAAELGIPSDFGFEEGEKGKDFYNAYQKRMTEILGDYAIGIAPTFESGGRVGYANAGTVMPGQPMQAAGPMNQAAGPTDQGPAPEDMGPITYEELRARLPQEVSDDIVRLLANSAEALEDFAMIQTEQDINNFNKKYGVTLVLPAEG